MALKTKTYKAKRQFIQKEKRLEKKHYQVFMALAIFYCIYYYFIEPKTIGRDSMYNIFIVWLPITIGIVMLGIYRRQFLLNRFTTNKGFVLWTFMIFFYFLQGIIFSYLSFGLVAKVCWDIASKQAARHNINESLVLDVTRFWTKRRPYSIDFKFQGKHEKINVDYQTLKDYKDENPKEYQIVIDVQEGLWNHYFINDWTIEKK